MKEAKLDINETTLVFSYPNLYYLDLNLKYKCDANNGNAKFDKNKKTLTIRLPIIGLTEDSKQILEEQYRVFTEQQKKRLEELKSTSAEDGDGESATQPAPMPVDTIEGETKTILPAIDMNGEDTKLEDKYNMN